MTTTQIDPKTYVTTGLNSWNQWLSRADKLFDSLSDDQLLTEIAPGKNRAIYIMGHLTAVNDSIIPQLRLGELAYPQYRALFIEKPDRSVELPPAAEVRKAWKDTNAALASYFAELTPEQWLERHSTVTEDDFSKEPHRNRLAILLSRTAHLSYHLGQLVLFSKR